MTVALVQQVENASTTNNPTQHIVGTTAGNFSFVTIAQQSTSLASVISDSAGNTYQALQSEVHPSGLSIATYRVRSLVGGNTILSLGTSAPAAWGFFEFSGVLPDQNVGSLWGEVDQPCSQGLGWSTGTTHNAAMGMSAATDFVLAFVFSLGNVGFTFQSPGWTAVNDIANANISFSCRSIAPGTQEIVFGQWTSVQSVVSCMSVIDLQAA